MYRPAAAREARAAASASASAPPAALPSPPAFSPASSPLPSPSPSPSPSHVELSKSACAAASPSRMGAHGSAGSLPPLPLPLRLLRQSSFGIDEPRTPTLRQWEEEEEEEEKATRSDRRPLMPPATFRVAEEGEGLEALAASDAHSYGAEANALPSDRRVQPHMQGGLPVGFESILASPSRRAAAAPTGGWRGPLPHTYHPLLTPLSIRFAPPPRVFHGFLLMSLCAMMEIGELCTHMARVCKQWQRYAYEAMAHPARRRMNYAATAGGAAIFAELNRLSSTQGVRQFMRALNSDVHTTLYARQRRELAAHQGIVLPAAPAAAAASAQRAAVPSSKVPSVTLLQHLQLLPSSSSAREESERGYGLMSRFRRMLPGAGPGHLSRLLDSHCLLLATHLVHLRVLRVYNANGVSNDGVKLLAHQLPHLRILHMGHLSDQLIDDRALQHIGENMRELHSLWLTQETDLPQRSMLNPHPRLVYNLFSSAGVQQLKQLHATLHHLNLGGFRNLTTQGMRLLSSGSDPLRLQSVHLNGWHITDECMHLLVTHHACTLYHLHLFDVALSNQGLRQLAGMQALETLLLDHCNDIDEQGMEEFVEESKRRVKEFEEAQEERARKAAAPFAFSDDLPLQPPLSLQHLELSSCSRLSLSSLLCLSLHPTLRSLSVSGRSVLEAEPPVATERALRQVEEMSGGRLQINGGRRRRRREAMKKGTAPSGSCTVQ